MENIAYNQAWIFSWIFHNVVILCSILQYVCFNLYNEKYHPMAMILKETKIKGEKNIAYVVLISICVYKYLYSRKVRQKFKSQE